MIRHSSKVFHNVQSASQRYTNLDDFQNSASLGKVKTLSSLTHELRLIKSPAELKLMRESASIACQVFLYSNKAIVMLRKFLFLAFLVQLRC